MTHKYCISAARLEGEIYYTYNEDGILISYETTGELTTEQLEWFFKRTPFKEEGLKPLNKLAKTKLTEVPRNLTFDFFWSEYKNKLGNKKRAQRLWDALSEGDRARALDFLPKFRREKMMKNSELPYPETYLYQERYNN